MEAVCDHRAGLCLEDPFVGMGLVFQHVVPIRLCVEVERMKKPTSQACNGER